MITKRYLTGGINGTTNAYNDPTALVGHTTAFDRAGNKLYERHLEAEGRSHLYQPFNSDGSFGVGYDSSNRLLQYQRGVLSSATIPYRVNSGASITTPTTLPGANQVRAYGLDGLGNWKNGNFTLVGSGGSTTAAAEVRQHNYVNEITSVKDTTGGPPTTTPFAYDANGNLLNDGIRIYQYDALNRLIKVSDAETSDVLATYVYDALGRRIQKTIADLSEGLGGLTGDILAGTTDYLYDGQQIIQERTDAEPTIWTKVYFWGQYIDELMFFAVAGESAPTTYRVLSDLLYRSVAIVTTSNVVTEAYDTDAYGNTLCYSGPGTDDEWFTDDDATTNNPINTTIFTGRQYDPESQIYYYRARYYSPSIGRFISRDPIGTAGGINLYGYVSNNPANHVDPAGLEKICCECVSSVKISNVKNLPSPFPRAVVYFHFDVDITLEGVCCKTTGDASLQWLENNTSPPASQKGQQPNKTYNQINTTTILPDGQIGYPQPKIDWDARKKICPGTYTVSTYDEPRIQVGDTLRINVIVTSAPNCPCPNKSASDSIILSVSADPTSGMATPHGSHDPHPISL